MLDDVVRLRLKDREDNKTVSDARREAFEMLTDRFEFPTAIYSRHKIEIGTGSDLKETIAKLYRKLIDRQFDKVD